MFYRKPRNGKDDHGKVDSKDIIFPRVLIRRAYCDSAKVPIRSRPPLIRFRSDFIGSYVNQISSKSRDLISSAVGGVLFIDEAYTLAEGAEVYGLGLCSI